MFQPKKSAVQNSCGKKRYIPHVSLASISSVSDVCAKNHTFLYKINWWNLNHLTDVYNGLDAKILGKARSMKESQSYDMYKLW